MYESKYFCISAAFPGHSRHLFLHSSSQNNSTAWPAMPQNAACCMQQLSLTQVASIWSVCEDLSTAGWAWGVPSAIRPGNCAQKSVRATDGAAGCGTASASGRGTGDSIWMEAMQAIRLMIHCAH
jgi:hypothetical protein